LKIIIFVLVALISFSASAEPIFPQHESCSAGKDKASDCDVILDDKGFLINVSTGERISAVTENTGTMSSNWLYKNGGKYVLEHLDYTSSKARQSVVFSYVNKKIVIDRVYIFSQEISMQSGPGWYGFECRDSGEKLINGENLTFSESVVTTLCGDAVRKSLQFESEKSYSAMGVTLAIKIPVYSSRKLVGSASYLFFDANQPDVFQMACYSNCALQPQNRALTYIGRVSNSAWFISEIKANACQSSGGYKYKKSQEKIPLSGCVEKGSISLMEYLPDAKTERAHFSGEADGEGYKGEWLSKSGDNKRFGFFMYPLTVY
jgi:hypothetical protein